MSVIPETKVGKIDFCLRRVQPWTQNAVEMGSSAQAVADWSDQVLAVQSAYKAQQSAQLAARDATLHLNITLESLMDATASIIKQVRARADLAGDGVYALASLPVPAAPSPAPAPGKPDELSVQLDATGALILTWKCDNPAGTRGTMYEVRRQIDAAAAGEFTYLGSTGSRKFIDATLPAGTAQVTYQIQAVRSTLAGPVARFIVNFGTGAAGQPAASAPGESRRAA